MQLQRQLSIELTLFLIGERTVEADATARALWAVLCEVEEFFGGASERLQVPIGRSVHVAEVAPAFRKTLLLPAPVDGLAEPPDREEVGNATYEALRGGLAADSIGRVSHEELGTLLRTVLATDDVLVVVTDLEIVPPAHLRYLVWDVFFNGAMVSTAPASPAYWGGLEASNLDHVAVVKWRARAACLAVVGSLLGMTRCDDDRCYLYENVDAVTRLDDMVYVGAEHAVEGVSGYGFGDRLAPPEGVATVQPTSAAMGDRLR